jgi:hypothetical protein
VSGGLLSQPVAPEKEGRSEANEGDTPITPAKMKKRKAGTIPAFFNTMRISSKWTFEKRRTFSRSEPGKYIKQNSVPLQISKNP